MADFAVTELDSGIDFDALAYWDVVIVGAGPAGLAAGLTTAHRGLTTLIVEAKPEAGGQPQFLYGHKRIVDVPGFPDGITGEELSDRLFRQASNARVQFRFNQELTSIDDTEQVERGDRLKRVVTSRESYLCRKVILAFGLLHFPRRIPILDALPGTGIHYKVPKTDDFQGSRVVIVGGGDSAFDAAVMVLERRGTVDMLVRGQVSGREDIVRRVVECGGKIHVERSVESARRSNDGIVLTLGGGETLECDLVIVQIGFVSARETFERLDIRLNSDGSIAIDPYYETSRTGIFAVGDVHGDIKLIPVAWAEGIQAAIYAFKEITSPFWLSERRLHDLKIALMGQKMAEAADRTHPPSRGSGKSG